MNTPRTNPTADLARLREFLRAHLLEAVVPFWLRHGVDPAGGLNTCLRDDGSLVSRDKWLWSQWRAVWTFARLHQWFGPNEQWLDLARQIAVFCLRHGWDEPARGWRLCVGGDGRELRGYDSIYCDAFAISGLTALAEVTGDESVLAWARQTAEATLDRLRTPHDALPHFPYPVPPGARVHGIPMMFSLVLWELGQLTGDDRYRSAALAMSDDIFAHFYRPDRELVLERIAADNREFPPPAGTAVVPGHVIEDMWFQIHIARDRGDRARIAQCVALTKRHVEIGWDHHWGGLLLAVDADGRADVDWKFADTKRWWPHAETLYALLLCYEQCGESWCFEWYDRVHQYAFARFPVAAHGEWRQDLTREGAPAAVTVALPVKDPFHLPRALMLGCDVLGRLIQRNSLS